MPPKLDEVDETSLIDQWDAAARWWDSSQGDSGDSYRCALIHPWLLSRLGSGRWKRILDIGCGNGAFCRVMAAARMNVVGVDASREMLRYARARTRDQVNTIRYIEGDELTEAALGRFDYVVSVFSLQDMPNPEAVCSKVKTLLENGGSFLLVLEDEQYMRSAGGHLTTRRQWDGAMSRELRQEVQRIFWNEQLYTYSYVRSLDYYISCLFAAGFSSVKEVALESTESTSDVSIFDYRDCHGKTSNKFVGVIASK